MFFNANKQAVGIVWLVSQCAASAGGEIPADLVQELKSLFQPSKAENSSKNQDFCSVKLEEKAQTAAYAFDIWVD